MREHIYNLTIKPRSHSLERVKKIVDKKEYYLLANGYADYRFEEREHNKMRLVVLIHDDAPSITQRQARDFYKGYQPLNLKNQNYVRTKFSFRLSKRKHPKIIEALNNADNPYDIIIEALNEYLSK